MHSNESSSAAEKPVAVKDEFRTVLSNLIAYARSQNCAHENTYRGGVEWEICSECDQKWSDRDGGKPEYIEPPAIEEAERLLAKISP